MSFHASYVRNISFKAVEEIFPDLFETIMKNSQQGFLQLNYEIPPEKEQYRKTLVNMLETLGFYLSNDNGKLCIKW